MSSLGASGLRTATTALALTVPQLAVASPSHRAIDINVVVAASGCIYNYAGDAVTAEPTVPSLEPDLEALYASFAEEDRQWAASRRTALFRIIDEDE